MTKKINHHFLQKALVKNFSKNGKIQWNKYKTKEFGFFHINNTWNEKQPIVKKNFYSDEIENEMNNLESEEIQIIRKISQLAQYEKEISLSRKENICLKFYSLLSGVRTSQLRNNILNKKGDSLFNMVIEDNKDDPKVMQEKMISTILKYWKNFKYKSFTNFNKNIQEIYNNAREDKIISMILINIQNTINSRLIIFKFNSMNLMLSESLNFTEQNSQNGGILLSFMPIFPNVGFVLYFDPVSMRGSDSTTQKSVIFKNDISITRNKAKYKNFEIIKKKQIEFIKNSKEDISTANKLFTLTEANKYYHKNDQFIYEVLYENEKISSLCNAMALVHNEGSILIYQNKEDIKIAEKIIEKRKIFKIEDIT